MKEYDFNALHVMTKSLHNDITSKLDIYLIEGLKRKGYEFDSNIDLITFIKDNCECLYATHHEIKTYTVKGEPFLQYDYRMNLDISKLDNYTITASCGEFKYL